MTTIVLNIASSRYADIEITKEFLSLVQSNNYIVSYVALASVRKPSARTYINSGFLAHMQRVCLRIKPDLIVCSIALQARYQRNLERALCVPLVDRTELLLSLFEKRAKSRAGQLQVELARLSYMQTKLVRGWTHLERQRGGIGLRGGPGETQIEVDRRILRTQIHKTRCKLSGLQKTRALNRQRRQAMGTYTIALVGYTNAGKSTLFNLITGEKTWASNQLFATLDPLVRKVNIPGIAVAPLLIDTVGFMRDLPDALITAFHATLEEINYCDLILHVVDCSDHEMYEKITSVDLALARIGATDIQKLTVFNKLDANPSFDVGLQKSACSLSALQKNSLLPLYTLLRCFVPS